MWILKCVSNKINFCKKVITNGERCAKINKRKIQRCQRKSFTIISWNKMRFTFYSDDAFVFLLNQFHLFVYTNKKNELLNLIKWKEDRKKRTHTFLTERSFDSLCALFILPRCYLKRPCKVECIFLIFFWNSKYFS